MNRKIRTYSKNEKLIEERRSQIFLGAAKLFLKKGYGRTSMRELAQYVGMTTMGLYHYIGSKEDIIHLILEYSHSNVILAHERILENIKKLSPTQALCNATRMYITHIDEVQDMTNFANHVTPSLPHQYRQEIFKHYTLIVDTLKEIIQRGIQAGEFREVNANLAAQNIMLLMQAWAHRRWLLKKNFTLEEYIVQQIDFIINSLKNTKTE